MPAKVRIKGSINKLRFFIILCKLKVGNRQANSIMTKTLALLILLSIFSINTFAQDFPYITLEGHENNVLCLAFSPDGAMLASGSTWDDPIRLWDVATGRHLKTLAGHTGTVKAVVFSPNSAMLASGSSDNTIRLWDVATGRHLKTFTGHTGTVRAVAFSPDGAMLASGSWDSTIRLWDVATGTHLRTLTGDMSSFVWDIGFSSDGAVLASCKWQDKTIHLWDVATGTHLKTLTGHTDEVMSVEFSSDGALLASGSRDKTIRLWDVATGTHLKTLTGHSMGSISVAFGAGGKMLSSASWIDSNNLDEKIRFNNTKTIRLWDATTGTHLETLTGPGLGFTNIAFSSDGMMLASTGWVDETIRLWRLPATHVRVTPYPVESPAVGNQFIVNLSITGGRDVNGYQAIVKFDPTVLRFIGAENGDYLPTNPLFVSPVVSENTVTLSAATLSGVSNGDGTLVSLTFEVVDVKESDLFLSDVILTDRTNKHLPNFAFHGRVEPALSSSSAIVSMAPASVLSPAIGEYIVFNVNIAGGQNVKGYQITLQYDETALIPIEARRGDYLPASAYFADPIVVDDIILDNSMTLSVISPSEISERDGELAIVTFEVAAVKASTVKISGYLTGPNGLRSVPTFESSRVIVPLLGDVNRDGIVNILDLVKVSSSFGQSVAAGGNPADVNEDGIINIVDLVTVASAINSEGAAPSVETQTLTIFTVSDLQQWLFQAQFLNLTDATSQRGIRFLEQLLAVLTPKETALLVNYPNPFNPETWIPYQLAEPANVTLCICTMDGVVVRTLALGHQPVGTYQDKSRAAYWDGRNEIGEPVASGVYFYTLTAGDFTATRKMLLRK